MALIKSTLLKAILKFCTQRSFSIVFGEVVRLYRLNERKSDYLKSLVNLKDKCFRSNFNQEMT